MHPDTQQVEIVTPTGRVLTQPSAHDALAVAAGKPVTRPQTPPPTRPRHGPARLIGNGIYQITDPAADQ